MYNTGMCILNAVGDKPNAALLSDFLLCGERGFRLLILSGTLQMGVAGAAIATVISQAVSAVMCFVKLLRSNGPEHVVWKRIRFDGPMLRQICEQGIPSGVQNSIISIANVVSAEQHQRLRAPTRWRAAAPIPRLRDLCSCPLLLYRGNHDVHRAELGAKEYDRAKRAARFGIFCAMFLVELLGVILYFISPNCFRLF